MKVFDENGKHVKTVPIRYKPIEKLIPTICSGKNIRLTTDERKLLDRELLRYRFKIFMDDLKSNEPLVHQYLIDKGDQVFELQRVTRRDDSIEFRIAYKNGIIARCQRSDFKGVPYVEKHVW